MPGLVCLQAPWAGDPYLSGQTEGNGDFTGGALGAVSHEATQAFSLASHAALNTCPQLSGLQPSRL